MLIVHKEVSVSQASQGRKFGGKEQLVSRSWSPPCSVMLFQYFMANSRVTLARKSHLSERQTHNITVQLIDSYNPEPFLFWAMLVILGNAVSIGWWTGAALCVWVRQFCAQDAELCISAPFWAQLFSQFRFSHSICQFSCFHADVCKISGNLIYTCSDTFCPFSPISQFYCLFCWIRWLGGRNCWWKAAQWVSVLLFNVPQLPTSFPSEESFEHCEVANHVIISMYINCLSC